MSLFGKFALAMVVPAAGALIVAGGGTAHAVGDLYGAIAVYQQNTPGTPWDHHTGVAVAVDYPSQAAADEAALAGCSVERCTVFARVHNECGSVVEYDTWTAWSNAVEPVYFTGRGPTAAAAEKAALDLGNQGLSFPTSLFFDLGLARVVKPLTVLDTICTSNAG
ncbi:DUF4189 domain-containing protein [Nocardia sp. NPDC050406]|uniref:DUF4189 domain-containing protein n=1 Tax=Nocardia sp. NPDC050406 TaxID=3364318 RepID=UPI0037B097D8